MNTRRVAAVFIAGGITLLSAPAWATQGPDHKITICHSGNGKHFTSIKVDYAGARGHAKTDSDDIIPPFEGFPGQGDQSILENQCQSPTTTTEPSTTTTSLDPTTTSSLPTTTTLTTVPSTTIPSTTIPTTQTTLRPATTTTVTVPTSVPTTTTTTITTSSVPPTTTTTLPTTSTPHEPAAPIAMSDETLPVTGSEPTGLVYGGLVLLALGLLLVGLSKWN